MPSHQPNPRRLLGLPRASGGERHRGERSYPTGTWVAGDAKAFRDLFDDCSPVLLRFLQRHVRDAADAQDLAQQTFLQLYRSRHSFRPGAPLQPWIFAIARNLARDLARRRRRGLELLAGYTREAEASTAGEPCAPDGDAVPPADAGPVPDLEVERLRAALRQLPARQREFIELHWFQGLSFPDIARMAGVSAGAARATAHRGYLTLRLLVGSPARHARER
jgi:RNA polymerase sigma-70 factor (ECF subfamily)